MASGAIKRIIPLFDRVLVERFAAETLTKGGLHLPEKAFGKVLNATVVAVGKGLRQKDGTQAPLSVQAGDKVLLPEYGGTKDGTQAPLSVQAGDKVLLPEYGGTKVTIEKKEYFIFKEADILGKWE
ncbi:unnamed protein product [Adineta steineri]|uniref:Chaperonin 10 n=1 Tax=Adineta steineri TaxID=433720 RepID=A0A813NSD4_9BILA|nr:unnamed protein product [Adineta steineri]